MMVFECGLIAMSSSPRFSSYLRHHKVNQKEVSRMQLQVARRFPIHIGVATKVFTIYVDVAFLSPRLGWGHPITKETLITVS